MSLLRQIESNRRNAFKSTGRKITAPQRHSQRSQEACKYLRADTTSRKTTHSPP